MYKAQATAGLQITSDQTEFIKNIKHMPKVSGGAGKYPVDRKIPFG